MKAKEIKDITNVVINFNPFLLRAENGKIMTYKNAEECYALAVLTLWHEFPLGFVDVAYFMAQHQGLSPLRIFRILRGREYCFLSWSKHNPYRNDKLRQILRLLLINSECKLDENLFYKAVDFLDEMMGHNRYDPVNIQPNLLNVID